MVVVGILVGLLGYSLLYTGSAKTSGDGQCTIGKAWTKGCSFQAPSGQGGAAYQGWPDARRRMLLNALDGQRSLVGASVY